MTKHYFIVVCQDPSVFKGNEVCYETFYHIFQAGIVRTLMKPTPFLFYFLLLFLFLELSACSDSVEKNISAPRSISDVDKLSPVRGGRIIMGTIGEPSNLIPYLSSDSASHEVSDLLFVAPLKYDKNLNIIPWAASSYEVLDEGRLLRFRLREDIRWEDGVALTADDVAFTYKLMINPSTPTAYAEDYLAVSEFKQTGTFTFEVRYEKPFARSLVTWMGAILPKHLLEHENIVTTSFARKPIGAGPYKLKEWIPGSRVTLEASNSYFEGRPNLDEVVLRIIPDASTMFLELKAGRLDMMTLSPQQYLRQTNGPEWEKSWHKYKYLSFSYTFLGFNMEHPFFRDVRVRQAISYAIDRQALIKGVLWGEGVPTVGPYKPGTWAYNTELAPIVQDVDKARELLKEAGWRKTNKDGILERDGEPFAFTILLNQGNDQRAKSAIIIQNQLKAIGIDVRIRAVEWAAFIKEFVNKGHFDTVLLAWTITQDPDIFDIWHSSKAKPGGLNFTAYRNAEVDALLVKARVLTDRAKRKELYDRLQEIFHEDQPYCFLYVPYTLPIVQSRFHGIRPELIGIMYNFDRWWVPKDLQRYRVQP